ARHGVVVARGEAVDILGAHAQQADVRPRADLAGEPQTSFDGRRCAGGDADAPRKEELDFLWRANGELAGVLEEEGALLRKEQAEAVEVDLLLVDLDLREIGVVGGVQGQTRRDRILQVEADFLVRLGAWERSAAARAAENIGRELQIALTRHAYAFDGAGFGNAKQVALLRERRPER